MVPSSPETRSPGPRGPEEFSPTGGRLRRATRTSADMWPSCQRTSSSTASGRPGPQASRFGGIGGGTECVRAHVADSDGLTGSPGGCCRGSLHLTGTDAAGKATTNLLGSVEFSPGERAGPCNERPRAVIIWRLSLKDSEHPLGAVSGPCRDKTSVGVAKRLWRSHRLLPSSSQPTRATERQLGARPSSDAPLASVVSHLRTGRVGSPLGTRATSTGRDAVSGSVLQTEWSLSVTRGLPLGRYR
jgi:hypothetical protein